MMKYFVVSLIAVLLSACFLSGCHRSYTKVSLEELIARKEAAFFIKSEGTLEFEPIKPVVYQGAHLRDPFEPPLVEQEKQKQYSDTILRTQSLDSLKLIGIVHHADKQWAVFRTAQGKLYRLSVGTRIGVQNAVITHIDKNEVKFTVEMNTSGGMKMQNIIMHVEEPEDNEQ